MSLTISGHVLDPDRRPVRQVKVLRKGKVVAESGDDGYFSATFGKPASRMALTFAAEGFTSNTRVYAHPTGGGGLFVKWPVMLWPITYQCRFDPSRDLDIQLGGSRIQVPANALVGPDANKLNEPIVLQFAWFDVTDPFQRAAAPGDFTGRMQDGSIRRLDSYGIFLIDLRDLKGQRPKLRRGEKISAALAIPKVLIKGAPRQVGLFTFDELAGMWIQAGSFDFAPDTLTYNGWIVNYGTPMNLDNPQDVCCVTVQVVRWWDSAPMAGFMVVAHGVSYDSYGTTDANGLVCLLVRKNATFWAEAHGSAGNSDFGTPSPPTFSAPNITSNGSNCGDPLLCPFLGTIFVDLIVGDGKRRIAVPSD